MSGDVDYRDAVGYAAVDGATVIAILRNEGRSDAMLARLNDDILDGVGDRFASLLAEHSMSAAS